MAGRPPRILCLDDQPEHLLIRKALLEQFGCEVVVVYDAQVCLLTATHSHFDLALLDYHLGGNINGEDVARDLRVCLPDLRLVMLTGDPTIPESAKESVDAVLLKGSSSPGDLLWMIRTLLPECEIKPQRPMMQFQPASDPP